MYKKKEKRELAIIILNYNGTGDTIECIRSLEKNVTEYSNDIFVLDNASREEELKILSEYLLDKYNFQYYRLEDFIKLKNYKQNSLIVATENYGFARGNNIIIEKVKKDYEFVLLLNNDTVVTDNFIEEMLKFLYKNPTVKYASCRINTYFDKKQMWNCGGRLRPWGNRQYYTEQELHRFGYYVPAAFITGCALFVDTELISKEKCFTEKFFFGEEDIEFCIRMQKRKVVSACLNKVLVFHKVGATSRREGNDAGKIAVHFSNRVVDMKDYYPKLIWNVWLIVLLIALKAKCKSWGYNKKETSWIIKTVKKYSNKDSITREDTFTILKCKDNN